MEILKALGFVFKRQDGTSHEQYEKAAEGAQGRRIVTVDTAERDFGDFLIKSMIAQSGYSRNDFYGATKRSARKASVKFNG